MSANLIADLPWVKQVAGHHSPVPFYLTAEMFGGLPVELAGAELSAIVEKPVASEHEHAVPEIYVLLSPEPGGAEIEVRLAGKSFHVTAPAAFFVPAGTPHCFVTKHAIKGSYCLGLLLGEPVRDQQPVVVTQQ
jgi:hypothetical protein